MTAKRLDESLRLRTLTGAPPPEIDLSKIALSPAGNVQPAPPEPLAYGFALYYVAGEGARTVKRDVRPRTSLSLPGAHTSSTRATRSPSSPSRSWHPHY